MAWQEQAKLMWLILFVNYWTIHDFSFIAAYTVEELQTENRRLRDSNERLETRIQLIAQTINELDILYRSSKSDSMLKRYTVLRDAVKEVITNPELTDAPWIEGMVSFSVFAWPASLLLFFICCIDPLLENVFAICPFDSQRLWRQIIR